MGGWWLVGLLAAPSPALDALIASALEAQARGDTAGAQRAALGWLSLEPMRPPPPELGALVAASRPTAEAAGPLRLYASRLSDRVRVGLHDPFHLVHRLVVTAHLPGEDRRMSPLEDAAVARLEFGLGGPLAPDVPVTVEIFHVRGDAELPLRSFTLPAETSLTGPARPARTATSAFAGDGREGVTPWWLVVLSLVAAGLAGAAVWQETR